MSTDNGGVYTRRRMSSVVTVMRRCPRRGEGCAESISRRSRTDGAEEEVHTAIDEAMLSLDRDRGPSPSASPSASREPTGRQ